MPKPLEGIRILDFTWANAGPKGTRHLANLGAEVLRLEWKGRLDFSRTLGPFHLLPCEEEPRDFQAPGKGGPPTLNRAAGFNDVNAGKLGVSLNMRHPEGKALFRRLLPLADVVTDNYTATTLADWGFSWEEMAKIRPDIIYVQQPAFGNAGPYRDFRSYGPIAAAVTGLTYMAGLPERAPVGYGFSYLDVAAPFFLCMAILSALHYRERTGQGQYMDLSHAGPGFLMTGPAILDYSANGRRYQRTGNRAPYTSAAPHGAYPCRGEDRWIAITVHDDAEWDAFCGVLGNPDWTARPEFITQAGRFAHQEALDRHVAAWTCQQDRYEAMRALQEAGVPAGVCQDTRDRVDTDPQLRHRGYVETVNHTEFGPYRVEGIVGKWSETQPASGGVHGLGGPLYAEHDRGVYQELLGLSEREFDSLVDAEVIG
jgi:crotonobetainyl-CoA:carnitine CoA-transferase CaiB-like acyl-CoA transferase